MNCGSGKKAGMAKGGAAMKRKAMKKYAMGGGVSSMPLATSPTTKPAVMPPQMTKQEMRQADRAKRQASRPSGQRGNAAPRGVLYSPPVKAPGMAKGGAVRKKAKKYADGGAVANMPGMVAPRSPMPTMPTPRPRPRPQRPIGEDLYSTQPYEMPTKGVSSGSMGGGAATKPYYNTGFSSGITSGKPGSGGMLGAGAGGPAPMLPGTAGTLGGTGYGPFPLGTGGPYMGERSPMPKLPGGGMASQPYAVGERSPMPMMAKGGAVAKKNAKIGKVMKEFKAGTLHSGAGKKAPVVKSKKQAIAIALTQARKMKKK